MKSHPCLISGLIGLAVLCTGCETDGGIARRERERPAAYASLRLWQKRYIEKGVIAKGFTPDMVYMAMGNPKTVQRGNNRELWGYSYYYPPGDLTRARYKYYEEQGMKARNIVMGTVMEGFGGPPGTTPKPAGMNRGVSGAAFRPGPPQGGSMEPADLQSYTIQVLFENGKVTQIGVHENWN